MNSNKARKAELYTVEAIKTFDKEFVEVSWHAAFL